MNGVVDMAVAHYKTSAKPEILAKVHQNLQLWQKFGRMQKFGRISNFGRSSVDSYNSVRPKPKLRNETSASG